MDVLLQKSVGLLDGLVYFLLHVGVRRVVFDQRSEVLVFVARGLPHKHPVFQLLRACLDLLSHTYPTLTVPRGIPRFDFYSCDCSSSRRGSVGGTIGSGFCDFFFLSLMEGLSSH